MPAPLVPGITEHRLKPFRKRGFDKKFLSEKWMRYRADSSPDMQTGNTRDFRSESASGTAFGNFGVAVFFDSILVNRSTTSVG
jgi:hypothetical protein